MEKKEEDESGSEDSELDDDVGPTDEEINEIFLKRYKMSKEELQSMADKMGIQLNNLCYLKQARWEASLFIELRFRDFELVLDGLWFFGAVLLDFIGFYYVWPRFGLLFRGVSWISARVRRSSTLTMKTAAVTSTSRS